MMAETRKRAGSINHNLSVTKSSHTHRQAHSGHSSARGGGVRKKSHDSFQLTVECFLRFCFVVKTLTDNVILQIFDIFTHELCLFFIKLTLLRHRNSIELKKDSIHE